MLTKRAPTRALSKDRLLIALAGIWVALMFVAFRPGLFSNDSFTHVAEAREGVYGDWHPPLSAFLLGHGALLAPWVPLLTHLLLIATAIVLLARLVNRRWLALALAAVALFTPPVWAIGTAVWKDVSTSCALLMCCVALAYRRPTLALLAAAFATGLRYNTVIALPPICLAIAGQYLRGPWYRRGGLALVFLIICAFTPTLVARGLRARPTSPVGQILLHDLAAIYRAFPADFEHPPSCLSGIISPPGLAHGYTTAGIGPLLWGAAAGFQVVPMSFFPEKSAELAREWRREVGRHPWTYGQHRLQVWEHLLGIGQQAVCYPFHEDIGPNELGLRLHRTTLAFRLMDQIRSMAAKTPLFRGWFWLGLCSLLACVGWWTRSKSGYSCHVAVSGVLYTIGYIPTVPSCDFRYLYWMVLACLVTIIMLAMGLQSQTARESTPGQARTVPRRDIVG